MPYTFSHASSYPQTSKAEEAARQADSDSAALRQRIVQLEGALRAKEREAERGQRAAEAARAAEAELAVRLADAEAAVGKMEGEAAAGRQRAAQLQEAVRARERELVALTRSLEQVGPKRGQTGGWGCEQHVGRHFRRLS